MKKELYDAYIRVLERELVPAMGCTEPMAVAYAAAVAASKLPQRPEKEHLFVSSNIIKNVKSVIVPNTGGLHGLEAAAAAGITYLYGGKFREIAHTIVNAIAINSGVICDGAKASCAAKIASAVEAGILGMETFRQGSQFLGGDGVVSKGVENTIDNVSRLASEGMRKTDAEIIKIMLS